jgi:dihydrolipoamide dehydrogenase
VTSPGDVVRVHTIVVGAGSAGLTVAVGLSRLGREVALVEAGEVGGDCTNVGCIPSKTLISLARDVAAAAPEDRAEAARAALTETRRRRDALRASEEAWLDAMPRVTLVRGRARLLPAGRGAREVEVTAADGAVRRLVAGRVVLATGSRPVVPPLPGLEADAAEARAPLTNATLFDLAAPPAHLAILGGGAIGCEMAFAFARLGSRVTIVEMADRVLPAAEAAASSVVHARLEALGVRVLVDTTALEVDRAAGTVRVAHAPAGRAAEEHSIEDVERLLVAVGRRAASDALGLAEAGVKVDGRGTVVVDGAYRTTAAGVFAIGDLVGAAHTHVANAQGRRLVRYLTLPLPLTPEGDHASVAFVEPEVGQVGPTLAQLRKRWPDALLSVHTVMLSGTDRGLTSGLEDGFVQVVAMRLSGRVLAATVVAPNASEMLPLLSWVQRRRVSLWQLARLEVAYPALSAAVKEAADAFVFASLPRLPAELATYLRWRWRRGSRA